MRSALPVLGLVLAACDGSGGSAVGTPGGGQGAGAGEGEGEGSAEAGGEGEGEGEADGRVAVGPLHLGSESFRYERSVTEGNLLKGFLTSHTWGTPETDFPTSMEFEYVSFAELMPAEGTVAVTEVVEPLLAAAAERGNHLVIRPYLDYPGLPSGVPAWLVAAGVQMRDYPEEDGGSSPDYESPALREALGEFVEAFGAAFDGDPRLGIVQLGLLGHWGEWHTYTHEEWFASADVQDEVMRAYDAAFPTTQLVIRYPFGASPSLNMGYHDDSFAHSTVGDVDWFFLPQLIAAGAAERWTWVPIGGEIRPELQPRIFGADWDPAAEEFGQDYLQCVRQTHASWMLNFHAFNGDDGVGGVGYTGADLERARAGALALGWEVTAQEVRMTGQAFDDGTADLEVIVDLRNSGVAPFYYPLELVVTAGCCGVERRAPVESLLPSEAEATPYSVRFDGLPESALRGPEVILALSSPMKLANQRMAFANAGVDSQGRLVTTAAPQGADGDDRGKRER